MARVFLKMNYNGKLHININPSNQMAMEQYPEETVINNNFIKNNETSSEKWKSLSESQEDSENCLSSGFDCNICLDSVEDPVWRLVLNGREDMRFKQIDRLDLVLVTGLGLACIGLLTSDSLSRPINL
uniref:Uncharacterized protein n=1 Tax=Lactuca sativa TaxID=4236 RepID=A0A9R1WZN3_LACSA|nr:hypothetical protein LSAT_V11C800442730 [Lactuca sativa]